MDTEQRQLLRKFLEGQCADHERQQVKALLDTPEGKTTLQELMEEQDIQAGLYALPGADERDLDDKAQDWKRQVHERIASAKRSESRPVRRLTTGKKKHSSPFPLN